MQVVPQEAGTPIGSVTTVTTVPAVSGASDSAGEEDEDRPKKLSGVARLAAPCTCIQDSIVVVNTSWPCVRCLTNYGNVIQSQTSQS